MYCPKCKVEYRRGFRRCSDCDVELVHELPLRAPPRVEEAEEWRKPVVVPEGTEFKALQRWDGSVDCANACLKLGKSGIAYRVTEITRTLGFQMWPRPEFEIGVPAAEYERAKEILGIGIELGEENLPSEAEIRAVMELPEGKEASTGGGVQGNWDPANDYREDDAVEIWSSRGKDTGANKGWMIELALKENRIRFHANAREDGDRSFFVRPADEKVARELVREIEEGAPPE